MKLTIGPDIAVGVLVDLAKRFPTRLPEWQTLADKPITIEVKVFKPRHTSEQQGKYWASLKEWGKQLGYSAKESEEILHEAVLCETYGTEKTVQYRGRIRQIPKKRSHDRDIEEYSELIETMMRMASEDGVYIE